MGNDADVALAITRKDSPIFVLLVNPVADPGGFYEYHGTPLEHQI